MQPEVRLFGSKVRLSPRERKVEAGPYGAGVLRMRRGDLMKPDLLSEIVLLSSGAVIFIAWLFIMLAALTGQIR
ncbi:MAG TPA: hypothetical protein VK639_00635 [Terriglobales bacterium]|jgi:hypothetical protein|nr:hypothetical protein [Terriglobales bacterium]